MSIFESKEYSSVSVSKSSNEEFDSNCLTIGNVYNDLVKIKYLYHQ
jgi:hypothetical protein